jgi:hypothetical protein
MKKIIFTITFAVFLTVPSAVFAKTVTVVGNIANQNTSAAGSSVIFTDSTTKQAITTSVSPNGSYVVVVPEGTYDISLIPPPGSGLLTVKEYGQRITSGGVHNFVAPSANIFKKNNAVMWYLLGSVGVFVVLIAGYLLLKKKKS